MTQLAQFQQILRTVRDDLLADMEKTKPKIHYMNKRYTVQRYLPWDINSGDCEQFADWVVEEAKTQSIPCTFEWLEQLSHAVVKYQGKYYDAEHIDEGADYVEIRANMQRKRPEPMTYWG